MGGVASLGGGQPPAAAKKNSSIPYPGFFHPFNLDF
jgi:hypothetical protein